MRKSFLVTLCLLLLAGCSSGQQGSPSASENAESESTEEPVVETAPEVTLDELKSFITYHEVTSENWNEYFTTAIEKDYVKDAFGEATSVYFLHIMSQIKNNYAVTPDLVMRFHCVAEIIFDGLHPEIVDLERDKKAVDYYIWVWKSEGFPPDVDHDHRGLVGHSIADEKKGTTIINEDYTVELVKSVGAVASINIPETVWQTEDETGEKFFIVSYKDGEDEIKRNLYSDGSWTSYRNGKKEKAFNPKEEDLYWPDDLPVNFIVNGGWHLFDLINQ